MKKIRLLHIYPDSNALNFNHSGGSKGIRIFNDFIESNNIKYKNCIIKKKSDLLLLKKLFSIDLKKYTHVLLHYPMFPFSVTYIRLKNPKLKIIIRSHNAEFPHWLHHAYLEFKGYRFKRSIKCFLTSIRNGFGEIVTGVLANNILAITEWEQSKYWRRRVFQADKILYAPYFINSYKRDVLKTERNKLCLCLMAPNHSAFLEDAAKNFCFLVNKLGDYEDWIFAITGDKYNLPNNTINVKQLGFVDNINELLKETSAIAVLTEYGYGFKTKVLEAAAEGCWSIIPKDVLDHIPSNVRPFCIPLNTKSSESFIEALNKTKSPLPSFEKQNTELRSLFTKSMKDCLNTKDLLI